MLTGIGTWVQAKTPLPPSCARGLRRRLNQSCAPSLAPAFAAGRRDASSPAVPIGFHEGARHTNIGINKLVFFALEAFLLDRATLITNAKIEAWEHGPVFRELYQSFKSYGNGHILGRASSFSTHSEEFEEVRLCLTEDEELTLKKSLKPLIHKSAAELRALSHRPYGAWHRVWWYEGHANPGMEITPALLVEAGQGR